MLPFLSFFFFFMAVVQPSRRSSNSKACAEYTQLEQHLPRSAQTLVSPLSEDDREVLHYMLVFGLHLQMLAGLVVPSSKVQWKLWKASSVKVGLKREYSLTSPSVTGKSRSVSQKSLSHSAHKPSGSCDCFSCYSSFWSRWAASPNRDLLNIIIDIAEMADIGDEHKGSKGKEKKKNHEKKRIAEQEAGGKTAKAGKWKLQNTPKTPPISSVSVNMDDAMGAAEVLNETSGCTSMDVMYDALWDSISRDETPHFVAQIRDGSVMRTENNEELIDMLPTKNDLLCRTGAAALVKVSPMEIENSRADTGKFLQTSSWTSSKQCEISALMEGDGGGTSTNQASCSGRLFFAPMQGESNLKLQRLGKCKSNQITPLFSEGTFVIAVEDQESSVPYERADSSLCLRLGDASLRGKGFLSCFLPNAVCGIASRLWDLVSIGSRT